MFVRFLSIYLANKPQNAPTDLDRIFNDFPLSYEGVLPVDPEKTAQRTRSFDDVIKKTGIPLDETVQTDLKKIASELTAEARQELFDTDGKLKSEIVTLLGLQPLIDSCQNDPNRSAEINHQILYSYCTQILFRKIREDWVQNFGNHNVHPLGPATRFIEKLFKKEEGSWSDFFIIELKQNRDPSPEKPIPPKYAVLTKFHGIFAEKRVSLIGMEPLEQPKERSKLKQR